MQFIQASWNFKSCKMDKTNDKIWIIMGDEHPAMQRIAFECWDVQGHLQYQCRDRFSAQFQTSTSGETASDPNHLGMSENGVYPQWNSHLIEIMISKTIGSLGYTTFSDTPTWVLLVQERGKTERPDPDERQLATIRQVISVIAPSAPLNEFSCVSCVLYKYH